MTDHSKVPPEYQQAKKAADQAWAYTATSGMVDARLGNGASRIEIVDFLLGMSSALAKLIASTEVEGSPHESAFLQGIFMENLILVKVREVRAMHDNLMVEASTQPKN